MRDLNKRLDGLEATLAPEGRPFMIWAMIESSDIGHLDVAGGRYQIWTTIARSAPRIAKPTATAPVPEGQFHRPGHLGDEREDGEVEPNGALVDAMEDAVSGGALCPRIDGHRLGNE